MTYKYAADYEGTTKLAYKILEKYSNGKLPIDVYEIIKKHPKIRLFTFSSFLDFLNLKYEDVIDMYGSDHGFTIYDSEKGMYMIVYNEKDNLCTQRWTLAHELGHVLKGHLKDENYDLLNYIEGKNSMEQEANAFAKHLLAPFPLIKAIQSENPNFDVLHPVEISYIFGLNYMPACNICEHLKKLEFLPRNVVLESKFRTFIKSIKIGPLRCFEVLEDYQDLLRT